MFTINILWAFDKFLLEKHLSMTFTPLNLGPINLTREKPTSGSNQRHFKCYFADCEMRIDNKKIMWKIRFVPELWTHSEIKINEENGIWSFEIILILIVAPVPVDSIELNFNSLTRWGGVRYSKNQKWTIIFAPLCGGSWWDFINLR